MDCSKNLNHQFDRLHFSATKNNSLDTWLGKHWKIKKLVRIWKIVKHRKFAICCRFAIFHTLTNFLIFHILPKHVSREYSSSYSEHILVAEKWRWYRTDDSYFRAICNLAIFLLSPQCNVLRVQCILDYLDGRNQIGQWTIRIIDISG